MAGKAAHSVRFRPRPPIELDLQKAPRGRLLQIEGAFYLTDSSAFFLVADAVLVRIARERSPTE